MMWIAVILGFAIGFVTGGKLSSFKNFSLNFWWLLPLYLLIDTFFNSPLSLKLNTIPRVYSIALLALQYISILLLVAINHRYKGLIVLGIGEFLNVLVIFSNGGRMPIAPVALNSSSPMVQYLSAGLVPHYVIQSDTSHLTFLGDILPIAFPVNALYSIGDIVIAVGLLIFTAQLLHVKQVQLKPSN